MYNNWYDDDDAHERLALARFLGVSLGVVAGVVVTVVVIIAVLTYSCTIIW